MGSYCTLNIFTFERFLFWIFMFLSILYCYYLESKDDVSPVYFLDIKLSQILALLLISYKILGKSDNLTGLQYLHLYK